MDKSWKILQHICVLIGMKVGLKKKNKPGEREHKKTILRAKFLHRRVWVSAHRGRFDLRHPIPCNRREMNSGGGRVRTFSSIF